MGKKKRKKRELKDWLRVYRVLIALRFLLAPIIVVFPIIGWIFSFYLDGWDGVFTINAHAPYIRYQRVDKFLDIWFRLFLVLTAFVKEWPVATLFAVLFLYRLAGELIIAKFGYKRQYFLILFPNLIEFLFPAYIMYEYYKSLYGVDIRVMFILIFIALILKIFQEYMMHVRKWHSPLTKDEFKGTEY